MSTKIKKNISIRDLNGPEILSQRAAKRAVGLYLFWNTDTLAAVFVCIMCNYMRKVLYHTTPKNSCFFRYL